jgi:hypothetical protein
VRIAYPSVTRLVLRGSVNRSLGHSDERNGN